MGRKTKTEGIGDQDPGTTLWSRLRELFAHSPPEESDTDDGKDDRGDDSLQRILDDNTYTNDSESVIG